jgi:Excreted virulence factor EspC, type VII ESX diderm
MNQFVANTGAMNGWQGIVDGVSGDVSNFKNAFSGPSDLASSHGAIGFPMQNAFDGAQSSRDSALGATQAAASRMAELLGQASQAYQRGDLAAAGRLKAQADQIEGASSPASAGGGANAAGAAGGGAGQMMGQFSQMAGQMAQSITQPLQGITQAMTQVPQQVMQGVQGIVEAATQAAGGGGDAGAMAAHDGADAGGAGAEHAVKANAVDPQGPHDGSGGGPADPQDAKHDDPQDGKDDAAHPKHEGDRDRPAEAGANADRHNEQLGNRASAGVLPEDRHGFGTVPVQARTINPRQ